MIVRFDSFDFETTIFKMKALIYQGNGNKALEDRPKPTIIEASDAIIKVKIDPNPLIMGC